MSTIQGHRNPFGKSLTEYTHAELDFVLEMAAKENSERYVFRRAGEAFPEDPAAVAAAWSEVLRDDALASWMASNGISRMQAGAAKWYARRMGGMRPGLSRGGKDIEHHVGHTDTGV